VLVINKSEFISTPTGITVLENILDILESSVLYLNKSGGYNNPLSKDKTSTPLSP